MSSRHCATKETKCWRHSARKVRHDHPQRILNAFGNQLEALPEEKSSRATLVRRTWQRSKQPWPNEDKLAILATAVDEGFMGDDISWGWKVFEASGVEPVFPQKRQAIDYAETRACFRSGVNSCFGCERQT